MATAQQSFYELYRGTSIGIALADTLDDLISSRRIEPQLAMRIMQNFDQSIASVLGDKVKARTTFKGHLDTYRFCDEVWTFIIKDVNFKLEQSVQVHADRVKIVACISSDSMAEAEAAGKAAQRKAKRNAKSDARAESLRVASNAKSEKEDEVAQDQRIVSDVSQTTSEPTVNGPSTNGRGPTIKQEPKDADVLLTNHDAIDEHGTTVKPESVIKQEPSIKEESRINSEPTIKSEPAINREVFDSP